MGNFISLKHVMMLASVHPALPTRGGRAAETNPRQPVLCHGLLDLLPQLPRLKGEFYGPCVQTSGIVSVADQRTQRGKQVQHETDCTLMGCLRFLGIAIRLVSRPKKRSEFPAHPIGGTSAEDGLPPIVMDDSGLTSMKKCKICRWNKKLLWMNTDRTIAQPVLRVLQKSSAGPCECCVPSCLC